MDMSTSPPAAARGGIRYGHLLDKLVNRPLLTTPRRALTLFGLLAPRAGVRADDVVAWVEGQGPLLLSRLVAEATTAPRVQGPKDEGKAYRVQSGVAIIPVTGDLVHDLGTLDPWCGMTGYDGIAAKLDLAEADPAVRGALLLVDSPGGEVTGCATCGDRIQAFRAAKPLRTAFADAGYSAACWLGAQGERVSAPRTGGTGSIGVITLHADLSAAYSEAGMVITVLTAGAHKADGHPFAPLPEAVAADIVAELQGLRGHFAAAVALGRGIAVEDVLATEARCLSAEEALSLGLIDEIASPDEALAQFIADLDAAARSGPAAGAAASIHPRTKEATMANRRISDDSEDEGDEDATRKTKKAKPSDEDGDEGDGEDDPEDDDGKGKKAAATATARIQAILTAPEAKGREAQAQELAFNTTLPSKQARAILAAGPLAQSGGDAAFAQVMARHFAGPALGGGDDGPAASGPVQALAAAVDQQLARMGVQTRERR